MNSLCIDVGSTFVKFFVYNGKEVLFAEKVKFPDPILQNNTVYEISIKSIDILLDDIFEKTKAYCVTQCFISVQMHDYIIRDKNGVFGNCVSWKDTTADIHTPLAKNIDFYKNGTSAKRNLPILKLLTVPPKDACEFFTLGSYIAYRLTGKNITHKTDGCASGFFDAETLRPLSLLKNISLPKVTQKVIKAGRYHNIDIFTPVGDHQVSFLGSNAGKESYLLNIGTATQLSTLSEADKNICACEKRPYFDHSRLFTISGLTGGEQLFKEYDAQKFSKEILCAVKNLPKKNKMLVGGGGAGIVFDSLKEFFKDYNIQCFLLQKDIGTEGLKMISKSKNTGIGTMLSEVCFVNFPIILKNNDLDFLMIDNEHGAFDYVFLSSIITVSRLIDLSVIIRLPDNNRKDITKLVDMGAEGFLLPMTNTPEDIKKVVDFVKYAPIGKRGISTNRAHTYYNPPSLNEYMERANQKVKIYAQIETRTGVENIDEILSVAGVDGVFIGPNDLSCDLNCIGNNQPVRAVIEKVSCAAKNHHKAWGIITTSKELIDYSLENDVTYISYGSEINMLKESCKKIRSKIYDSKYQN